MKDPVADLADNRFIEMAADVQVQLERGTATRPVLWLLSKARERAVIAMMKMIELSPSEADAMASLQNDVLIYRNMIDDCRQLMQRSDEADLKIAERNRQDISEIVMTEQDRQIYGQPNQGYDA